MQLELYPLIFNQILLKPLSVYMNKDFRIRPHIAKQYQSYILRNKP